MGGPRASRPRASNSPEAEAALEGSSRGPSPSACRLQRRAARARRSSAASLGGLFVPRRPHAGVAPALAVRFAVQVLLDLLPGGVLAEVLVPFLVLHQAHLEDPLDGRPALVPFVGGVAGAGHGVALPVFVLLLRRQLVLDVLEGRVRADVVVLVPLRLLHDAGFDHPLDRQIALRAFLGRVARPRVLIVQALRQDLHGLLAARHGAELVEVVAVLR
mmetsp:Transcript_57290/g.153412  ORF Transcript_57290/g.153412 Transcript_57290/m.153412 type:complete len:217 (+) Transcript_57290:29-679(+)